MENYIISFTITIIFLLLEGIRFRETIKEETTYKPILKNTIIVFVSCMIGIFCIENLQPEKLKTKVYTDNPNF